MIRYLPLVGLFALTACSGGPSNGDIQRTLQALEQHSEIVKVEDTSCADAKEGRYRCSFKATLKSGNWVRDRELSRLFEKRPSGWAVAKE